MDNDLENAHELAFVVVGEAFELHDTAGRYAQATNPARRRELAEKFLDHLYKLETAFQPLRKFGLLFRRITAFADGRCRFGRHLSASAHAAVICVGLDAVTGCMDTCLRNAFPDKWPPQISGEYTMPDTLPRKEDAAPFADAIITRFQEQIANLFPLDDLNELSPRLEQEYARAVAAERQLASRRPIAQQSGSAAKNGSRGRPNKTAGLARFANTRRKRKPPMTWPEIHVEYIAKHPDAKNDNGEPLTEVNIRDAWRRAFGSKSKKTTKRKHGRNSQ